MSELTRLTATELASKIHSREVTAEQVTRAHLDRIAAVDELVHAFLHVDAERALVAARAVDAELDAGQAPRSPLAGVPVAVKDVLVTEGTPTTSGSKILENWIPPYDATVVRRLREAGLVILGKTNMDEFAMGSSTENSAYGPTFNPWALDRVPGGSSGGSVASLAAFEAPLAIGSDTGGSIRQPAAMTGTVGVKPSYGGVSRYGLIAFASSLDHPGSCARTVLDAAMLHEIIGGHDPLDSTSINAPAPPCVQAARQGANGDLSGVRIGVVLEISDLVAAVASAGGDLVGEGFQPGVLQSFRSAINVLRDLGAEIVEISCPHFTYALPAYYLISSSEASSNLARFDGIRYGLRVSSGGERSAEDVMSETRSAGFGAEVKRRIILGTYALSAGYFDEFYGKAQKVRTLVIRDFQRAFEHVDVLISPTAPTTAFKIGERVDDPLAMYLGDLCTIPADLAGTCAISVPSGLSSDDGLPVGLQFMAPVMDEKRIYHAAAAYEAARRAAHGMLIDGIPPLQPSAH